MAFGFLRNVVPFDGAGDASADGRIQPNRNGVFSNLDDSETHPLVVGIGRRSCRCRPLLVVIVFVVVLGGGGRSSIVFQVSNGIEIQGFFRKKSRKTLHNSSANALSLKGIFLEGFVRCGQFFRVGHKGERPNRLLRFHGAAHDE